MVTMVTFWKRPASGWEIGELRGRCVNESDGDLGEIGLCKT